MNKSWTVCFVIFLVLLLDQILKIYIKTNFAYAEGFDMLGFDWAKIRFIENNGMAFGLSLGGTIGKLVLSLFRLVMIGFLVYLLRGMIKAKESIGILISFSLILAGAVGNMIDSAFYGLIFSESSYHGGQAILFPEGGGYASFLHGKVVDMFYFPIIDTVLPEWVPFWGGDRFEFFKPIFNIADVSISTGVISILLFHRKFFSAKKVEKSEKSHSSTAIFSPEEE